MTSALVVAVLLSEAPRPEVDGHAVFAKAQQVMLGGARRPWLLLATGSIARSDKSGEKPSERFVVEWEPCGRRDIRGYVSGVADVVLTQAVGVLCGSSGMGTARVDQNGSYVRYVWDESMKGWMPWDRVTVEIDPEAGLVTRARLETRWQTFDPPKDEEPRIHSRIVGTFEVSDYKPVGTMRLPHRLQLQAEDVREDWTIERIEIVPLP